MRCRHCRTFGFAIASHVRTAKGFEGRVVTWNPHCCASLPLGIVDVGAVVAGGTTAAACCGGAVAAMTVCSSTKLRRGYGQYDLLQCHRQSDRKAEVPNLIR